MAFDGTYFVVYARNNEPGIGVLTIADDGIVKGSDYAGGKYEGSARRVANGGVELSMRMDVSSHLGLVGGRQAQGISYRLHFQHTFAQIGTGKAEEVAVDDHSAPVTVWIWRISDAFASGANGFKVTLSDGRTFP